MELTSRHRNREESLKQPSSLNDLPDFLLAEILHRLPLISAQRSKLVCKGWYSVISQPYFSEWFSHNKKPYSLLSVSGFAGKAPTIYSVSEFESSGLAQGLSLGFMPGENIIVETSSNDLLLCFDFSAYLVCNPVTREWTRVPIDVHSSFPIPFVGVGIYGSRLEMLKNNSRTRLLKFQQNRTYGFRQSKKEMEEKYGVSCKDLLFWLDDSSGTVAGIDAFDILSKKPGSWLFIDPPKEYIRRSRGNLQDERHYNCYLETCRGNLRLCQLSRKDLILSVWDLKNTEWLLHNQAFLREIAEDARNLIAGKDRKIECCDPNDPNVIYTSKHCFQHEAVSFNLLTRAIKTVPPCPYSGMYTHLVPYKLQWHPTRLLVSNN